MNPDLPAIVTLNAQSSALSAQSDGQLYAVNNTPHRYRVFTRRVQLQADPKYVRARCGPMKESMLEPGGNAKFDDVLSKEFRERAATIRRGRPTIAVDVHYSRVGGAEPPARRVFDVLAPSAARHGRGFVIDPCPWLMPADDLPLICTYSVVTSDDPAAIDTRIFAANVGESPWEVKCSSSSVTTYDGTSDQLLAPANRGCEAEIAPGEVIQVGEVARWEWYHSVVIDVIYKRGGKAVVWQDYDLGQMSPVKHIVAGVGISKLVLPRSWAVPL